MQRTNVYAGVKGQILKEFSNMPETLQAHQSGTTRKEHGSYRRAETGSNGWGVVPFGKNSATPLPLWPLGPRPRPLATRPSLSHWSWAARLGGALGSISGLGRRSPPPSVLLRGEKRTDCYPDDRK